MAKQKRQDTDTGSGSTKTPILASEKDPTEGQLQPSQPATSIESGSTKPLSKGEALSLLQTGLVDLRALGCAVSILATNGRLYIRISDTGGLDFADGHITLGGKPVSVI